jgi:hypothetical protein
MKCRNIILNTSRKKKKKSTIIISFTLIYSLFGIAMTGTRVQLQLDPASRMDWN